ncbi:L-Ala-D/L-Glu epimerase [bioreactor metagenome]|uniref:L-Ala-D/L-Glu epimerase n=1 Tax=bioreactor metagenome TaxID=1076179 RepID=A0A645EHV8_9ZZZZ
MDLFDKTAVLVKIKSCIQRNTSAKAACEIAYFDLYTKTMGIPLYKYFGASKPVSLKTDITISLDTPEKMVSDSVTAIGRGFDILKLKLGGDPRSDLYRLEAVREAVGKKIILRIDANQGWSPKEAIFIINEAERRNLGVELVEQPVKAADIEGLETVSKGVLTPVLADEAVFGISDAIEVIKRGAADMINIKLMKTGGLNTAASVISICREYGVRCMMGCMLENPVGVIAAAHLAAANADVVTKIDLDPPFLISENPVSSSVKFEKGNIILSDAPGLGVEINYDRK